MGKFAGSRRNCPHFPPNLQPQRLLWGVAAMPHALSCALLVACVACVARVQPVYPEGVVHPCALVDAMVGCSLAGEVVQATASKLLSNPT